MDRREKKALAEAEKLKSAAASGDPGAMWSYALMLAGLRPPAPGQRMLPFLIQTAESMRAAHNGEASELMFLAADAGHTQAMFVAAGLAEPSDPARARELLERASGLGDTAAMFYLGAMLPPGPEAVHWLTKVAESGDPAGMYQLSQVLAETDPGAAQAWLRQAADAGNLHAQSDIGVQAASNGAALDRSRPPAADPRKTGVFGPKAPATRHERVAAECTKCQVRTVQDHYEFIVGKWFGVRGPTTAGKTGTRVHFSVCAICGCMFPLDDAAREYTRSKGGEFFNPAKLAQNR